MLWLCSALVRSHFQPVLSYEKNSKVHSEWNRSYGKSDSIVAGSYDNVPVMLYVMGFKPGLSGGRCEKL